MRGETSVANRLVPPFTRSLAINFRVVGALMMREGSSRYGHENLGFFWIMGEPLILTLGVMVLWGAVGMTHGHAVGVVPFALSGYTMLMLWRHLTGRAVHAMRNNGGLLFHRNVRILDVMVARAALEIVGVLGAFLVAWVPLALTGFTPPMSDPLLLFGGYFLLAWFSFSVGLIIAALSEIWEPTEQFIQPLLYLTLPATGVFTMAAWLPQGWREALMWSPLANAQEMMRAGMFPPDVLTFYDPAYLALWSLALTAAALPLAQFAQSRVSFA